LKGKLILKTSAKVLDDAFSSQLDKPVPMEPYGILADRTGKWVADLSKVATTLAMTKVLDVFPDPHPEDHLHIIVIKPGERCASYDVDSLLILIHISRNFFPYQHDPPFCVCFCCHPAGYLCELANSRCVMKNRIK
jgi:hypothetical protein